MRVLLDSGAYSQLMQGREQVSRIVRGAEEVLLSAVVLGELLYGFRRGSRYERNARQMRATTSGSRLTPWRRGPIWCRPTATSNMWTGSPGFG